MALETADFPTSVARIVADVTAWEPERSVHAWHDRAVLHFMASDDERQAYARVAAATVAPGGVAIIGTYGPDGPDRCSGLEVRRSSADEVAGLLGDGFAFEEAHEEFHPTAWGASQQLTWTVLRRR